ncbi:hypothetical protein [Salinigranum halophilum]|jgi:hypothetical protein|uniref:hypothetical protein n=1 Tax=Salinigranum halophilum TaxID=2565931 RepID=UPI00115CE6C1|nr:hypothetical protein [Salinigranum halophilum]
MTASRLDWLARGVGDFLRFVLLWVALGSVTGPLRTIISAATSERLPWWTASVTTAVLATAVYWSVGRLSWRLVGRAWLCGIVVSVISVVGFVLFPFDESSSFATVVLVFCWWLVGVGVGVGLTSPTLWRSFRDRVLLRPRS